MGHDARLKSHFLKGYMPDIVLVFFANEILSTKVVENWKIQCKMPPKTKRFYPLVPK